METAKIEKFQCDILRIFNHREHGLQQILSDFLSQKDFCNIILKQYRIGLSSFISTAALHAIALQLRSLF